MAFVNENRIVVTASKLVKQQEDGSTPFTDELISTLEKVVEELVGSAYVIEVTAE